MELTNSSAIVTGGASGIGAAAARLLAKKGAKVVIADLQADKGEEPSARLMSPTRKTSSTQPRWPSRWAQSVHW
jgi:NAD(P)-dependent dehydrogenase (short-subunit alcohol dehydrogenase family)